MPVARVHSVIIFTESTSDKFKAAFYFYYVTRKHKARLKFMKEFPGRKILKTLYLGVSEVEFDEEKYNELYEED